MDRMLELPVAERVDWVRALEGVDAQFRPQLLELLQADTDARTIGWLDTLPKLEDGQMHTLMEAAGSLEQPGDTIGPYRLARLLGAGGMGNVWYAERTDGLMRRGVALKLPHGSSRQFAARFEREREIVAGLVHPNIARLYDAGITAQGQAYLALEYAEGQALDKYCNIRRLNLRGRILLFGQVLSAVQYAHSRLVIHRDIKPSNILVTNDGEVRLLDFGVAKLLDGETSEPSDLTRQSDAGMTLAYASPEQVAGRPVTTATDVYSLGVVLFELLAGTRPYRVKRRSRGALEEAILQADIPLASAVAADADTNDIAYARSTTAKRLRYDLRGDLDAILLKALSRLPQNRYETAASFADDLERFLNGRAVRAHRRSRWYQLRKFVGRNRIAVAATLSTVLVLAAATGVAVWQAREAERQANMAAMERDRALAAAEHRAAVDEFMADLLLEAGRNGKPISVSELIARADRLSAAEFANNPEARAAVLRTMGAFALEFDGPVKALADFDKAQEMLASSRDIGLRSSVACDRALLQGVLGKRMEAQAAIAGIVDDPALPSADASACFGNLSQLAIFYGDGPAAAAASAQALARWEESPRRSPTKHLELLMFQAEAQNLTGEPARAEEGYSQVMEELKRLGRERGPLGYTVRNYRIRAAIDSGDLPLARRMIEETISIMAADVPDRALPALTLYDKFRVSAQQGRYSEANAGLDLLESSALAQDRVVARRAALDEAMILAGSGRASAAEAHYSRGTARDLPGERDQPLDDETLIAIRIARATLDLEAGRFHAARENMREGIRQKASAASIATMYRLKARADLGDHDVPDAVRDAKSALEISRQQQGDKPYSYWVGQSEFVLAQAYWANDNSAQARQACETAVEHLERTVEAAQRDLVAAKALLRKIRGGRAAPVPGA